MKSKIIVIEGLDGSGKATQTKILCEKFSALGKKVTKLEFPNYESPAAAPVKMYLDGEFGDKRNGVVHSPSDRNADKHRGTNEGRQNGDQVENRRGVHGVTLGKEARCL